MIDFWLAIASIWLTNMREQLNVRVAQRLKSQIKKDRSACGKTNDIIVEVALESFFTGHDLEARKKFYRNHDRTPYARTK